MAMIVQHNITAMNASRMLGVTTGVQSKTSEKLASGYRINRASDDAAGLSISEKMRSQIRGLDRASTNAQDGVSAVQTAEGALQEVHSMLQRMNELAVQSANGTNSDIDRDAIQAEIEQLTEEIDRVAESTKFNETYLLKGDETAEAKTITTYSYKTVTGEASVELANNVQLFAEGDTTGTALDEEAILEALENNDTLYTTKQTDVPQEAATHGTEYTVTDATVTGSSGSFGTATIDNTKAVAGTYTYDGTTDNRWEYANGDEVDLADIGITLDVGYTASDADTITVTAASVTTTGDIYKLGEKTALSDVEIIAEKAAGTDLYKTPAATTQTEAVAGTDYTYTPGEEELAVLYDENGKALKAGDIDEYLAEGKTLYADAEKQTAVAEADLDDYVTSTTTTVNGDLTLSLHVGADSDDTNKIELSISSMSAAGIGVDNLDVSSSATATAAIDTIKAAIQQVSNQRSALGAIQNRLEHTIANLDNVVENTTSAESRIRDTDMAEEMVEYSKNQILAQAGQSMLAQANQSTQGVLSLLQ